MTDQETPEGGALPSGANASPPAEVPKGSEAGSPPAAADPGEKKVEPKDGRDIRIGELTRRLREAERREQRLMRAIEERGQPASSSQPQQPANGAAQPSQPAPFDPKKFAAELREEETAAIRRERFEERQAKFAETTKDYYEVTDAGEDPERNPRWACSQAMAEVIEESDEGPALVYYLAQNPDEARKMSRLSPAQAGKALAHLEDRLVSERKKAAEKPVSKAPEPPPKLDGADPGNVEKDRSKMSDAEFSKYFRKLRKRS